MRTSNHFGFLLFGLQARAVFKTHHTEGAWTANNSEPRKYLDFGGL
jgi:hypothetical protein